MRDAFNHLIIRRYNSHCLILPLRVIVLCNLRSFLEISLSQNVQECGSPRAVSVFCKPEMFVEKFVHFIFKIRCIIPHCPGNSIILSDGWTREKAIHITVGGIKHIIICYGCHQVSLCNLNKGGLCVQLTWKNFNIQVVTLLPEFCKFGVVRAVPAHGNGYLSLNKFINSFWNGG